MPLKLYRRGSSPNWYIRGTLLGRAVDQSAGTPERSVAEQIRIRIEQEIIERQIHGERGSRTFAEAAVAYVETVQPRGTQRDFVIGRQLKNGRASFNLVDTIGARRLRDIGPATVTELAGKHFGGAAPATINRNLIAPLSAVMRFAAGQGWCDLVTLPRRAENNARDRWLSTEEAETLLRAAAPHIRPLLAFLLLTGARMAEALELEWRDVDLAGRWAVFRRTKRGEPRGIPLSPGAVAAIANINGDRRGRVFRTQKGEPYADKGRESGGQIKSAWAGALRRAGIDDLHPHDLRHTFSTWLTMAGVSPRIRDEIMGHATADIGSRYAHVPRSEALKSVLALPALIWEKSGKPKRSDLGRPKKTRALAQ